MKIINIGRNYAAHAKKLGNEVPDAPLIFVKPATAYASTDDSIEIPSGLKSFIKSSWWSLSIRDLKKLMRKPRVIAPTSFLGLDLTARDIQNQLKSKGHPLGAGKGFRWCGSGRSHDRHRRNVLDDRPSLGIEINGEVRQSGHLSGMMWQPAELLAEAVDGLTLEPGDLVFTGTPPGVGPLRSGDTLVAKLSQELRSLRQVFADERIVQVKD